jgi:ABC-type glycerol-3-phosphate transport system permease component
MLRDRRFILWGEDFADYEGAYSATLGFFDTFGRDRIINTAFSATTIVDTRVGAAIVDGCTRWRALFRIIIPMAVPEISVVFLFSFIFCRNEDLIALSIIFKNAKTLPVGMSGSTTLRSLLYWDIAVNALVIMVPPLIVTLSAKKYIIRGLVLGTLKQ